MLDSPKVALLLRLSVGYDREIMRGIVDYSRFHGPWSFFVPEPGTKVKLSQLNNWGCSGIVAQIENKVIVEFVRQCRVPLVAVPGVWPSTLFPIKALKEKTVHILVDREKVCKLVADHFHSRGFQHYAFCGFHNTDWSLEYQEKFCKQIQEMGHQVLVYDPPRLKKDNIWPKEQNHLGQWLKQLPKPVAIMACCDERGRQIIDTCRLFLLKVPEEIAVVGVDNDDIICNLANPPMSSVALNTQNAGYEAATLLDKMMKGKKVKKQEICIDPVRMVTRVSSDILALTDPILTEAIRYIRKQAQQGISVSEVAEEIQVSRRKLQLVFQRELERSVHDEIRRVQLEKVKQLLLETNIPISRITEATGFTTREYMAQIFRKHVGMTLRQYRKKYRN